MSDMPFTPIAPHLFLVEVASQLRFWTNQIRLRSFSEEMAGAILDAAEVVDRYARAATTERRKATMEADMRIVLEREDERRRERIRNLEVARALKRKAKRSRKLKPKPKRKAKP